MITSMSRGDDVWVCSESNDINDVSCNNMYMYSESSNSSGCEEMNQRLPTFVDKK